jgi:hypothetical protein
VLKVEFHTHTADDPADPIPYSTPELIDRAAALGFDALAITLHNRQLDLDGYRAYAESAGITLIPGIEKTICGRHVLLLNFSRAAAETVTTFEQLAALKQAGTGLVIAPHPFFPAPSALHGYLRRHADLFDAVEINAMFTRTIDFNVFARRWAAARGVPLVGAGDVHRLEQMGTTYSLVDADRSPQSICAAVRAGRVRVHAEPLTTCTAVRIFSDLVLTELLPQRAAGVRSMGLKPVLRP